MERRKIVDHIQGLASVAKALEQAQQTIFVLNTELYKALGRRDARDEQKHDRLKRSKEKQARREAADKQRAAVVIAGLDALRGVLAGVLPTEDTAAATTATAPAATATGTATATTSKAKG